MMALRQPPDARDISLTLGVTTVGKDMAQAGERDTHARQQVGRAVTILHVGWMDDHPNPPADGVGEDLPLTALDHLFGRIAARANGHGRLDRLAVDHTSGRTVFSGPRPRAGPSAAHDCLPHPIVSPCIEISLHRRIWR
jgi:hypothetical protein